MSSTSPTPPFTQPPTQTPTQDAPILLIGNPNVGKSVLFSALTGTVTTASNYPGTTIEITRGRLKSHRHNSSSPPPTVIDTPGVNTLIPQSGDEEVTRRILTESNPQTVVLVADAKNLRRTLTLLLQLQDTQLPLVLALNMSDECREQGIVIDQDRLSRNLGIPVVATEAICGKGIDQLLAALPLARPLAARPVLEPRLQNLAEDLHPHLDGPTHRRRLLTLHWLATGSWPDPVTPREQAQVPPSLSFQREQRARTQTRPLGYTIIQDLHQVADRILADCFHHQTPPAPTLRRRVGEWSVHPVWGGFVLAGVLYALFWFVGLFGAGVCVDFLETVLFQQNLNPAAIRAVDAVLPFPHEHAVQDLEFQWAIPLTPSHDLPLGKAISREVITPEYTLPASLSPGQKTLAWVHGFLVGPFGVFTMALSYAFAIVLPIVVTFFLVFSFLEDVGYLPRLALLVNRTFRIMGLNGKAVLPMVLGLGCDTMATMTTRILETRKERVLTTLLLALGIPCSAQLGVLLAMTAQISVAATLAWLATITSVLLLVGFLAARVLPGGRTDLIMEIPPIRWPKPGNILLKTLARLEWYLKEVIPLFVLGTACLYLLESSGLLTHINLAMRPIVSGLLGLPQEVSAAFLIGFLRRDYGAVYLLDAATGPNPILDHHQILVAMITITLFMPCIANVFVIWKEHSGKTALAMMAFIFPFAFLVGGIVHRIAQLLGTLG